MGLSTIAGCQKRTGGRKDGEGGSGVGLAAPNCDDRPCDVAEAAARGKDSGRMAKVSRTA